MGKALSLAFVIVLVLWFVLFGLLDAYDPHSLPDSPFMCAIGRWGVEFAFDHPVWTVVILLLIVSVGGIADDKGERERAAEAVVQPYLQQLKAQEAVEEARIRRAVQEAAPYGSEVKIHFHKSP